MDTKKTDKHSPHDIISTEFNLIRTSSTVGGVLTHLESLFKKLRYQPHFNRIIASTEVELTE